MAVAPDALDVYGDRVRVVEPDGPGGVSVRHLAVLPGKGHVASVLAG